MEESPSTPSVQIKTNAINVLVYSEDETAKTKFTDLLKKSLDDKRYTIYPINEETLTSEVWKGKTALMAVTGKISKHVEILIEYYLEGGKMLALNSDLVNFAIPRFLVVPEVGETFTYDDIWELHKSNKKQYFNTTFLDMEGQVVNMEECSESMRHSPILVTANGFSNKGELLLSQIACLIDKTSDGESVDEETILTIFKIILKDVLGLHVKFSDEVMYTPGYLLQRVYPGKKELDFIANWLTNGKLMKTIEGLTLQWCSKDNKLNNNPSNSYLPVYVDGIPENFSHDKYFACLESNWLGKVLIYSDVMTSTMDLMKENLANGIAVVAGRQTTGKGRGGNAWITPLGQAAISVQIWKKITDSTSVPLIQHITALAITRAIRNNVYKDLDIRIKWPNDIYYGHDTKIGGVVTVASCMCDDIIVNIGVGVNISNEFPTTCVNSIIEDHTKHNQTLPLISVESFLAKFCTELEALLDQTKTEQGVQAFKEDYCKVWLHTGQQVRVKGSRRTVEGRIKGVDSSGWLLVQSDYGETTVAPDGNSFDMMNGLISKKF